MTTRHSPQRRLSTGPLLDPTGRLVEAGWSDREVRQYDRSRVRARPLRVKEWDYYCVLTDPRPGPATGDLPVAGPVGLALTVADNDYLGLLSVSWLDLGASRKVTETVLVPLPRGRWRLPPTADRGVVRQRRSGLSIEYRTDGRRRSVAVTHPRFDGGAGLHAELELTAPSDARMAVTVPFPDAPAAFYYNQKIPALSASGYAVVGGVEHRFAPATSFGVFDWGRGVWPYANEWYWGSASGIVDGSPVGLTVGHGFGDTSAATENVVTVAGRLHKLSDVTLAPAPDDYTAPWRVTGTGVDLTFRPILDRASDTDVGLLRSDQHQVFGRYHGTVDPPGAARLTLDGLLGFAEHVRNRW